MWRAYVPVAVRRARALREMNRLRKKGKDVRPVEIEGRTIARSVWGKRWCTHLESYSDYANRLPRGRAYVRNGSVCHLEVHPGRIEAIVSGSELYSISVRIKTLKAAVWRSIKTRCSGQIGSMLELLQGKLSRQVMSIVTDRENGLFPKPREIDFSCSCPDWATMCKHVAAVLYGVGSRLDQHPESLFLLRGADAEELIAAEIALPGSAAGDDTLADDALAGIFGIDIDIDTDAAASPPRKAPARARKGARRRAASPKRGRTPVRKAEGASASGASADGRARKASPSAARARARVPAAAPRKRDTTGSAGTSSSRIRPTGKWVARLRRRNGLSVAEFASRIGVSAVTVYRWEAEPGRLNLQARSLSALTRLHRRSVNPKKR